MKKTEKNVKFLINQPQNKKPSKLMSTRLKTFDKIDVEGFSNSQLNTPKSSRHLRSQVVSMTTIAPKNLNKSAFDTKNIKKNELKSSFQGYVSLQKKEIKSNFNRTTNTSLEKKNQFDSSISPKKFLCKSHASPNHSIYDRSNLMSNNSSFLLPYQQDSPIKISLNESGNKNDFLDIINNFKNILGLKEDSELSFIHSLIENKIDNQDYLLTKMNYVLKEIDDVYFKAALINDLKSSVTHTENLSEVIFHKTKLNINLIQGDSDKRVFLYNKLFKIFKDCFNEVSDFLIKRNYGEKDENKNSVEYPMTDISDKRFLNENEISEENIFAYKQKNKFNTQKAGFKFNFKLHTQDFISKDFESKVNIEELNSFHSSFEKEEGNITDEENLVENELNLIMKIPDSMITSVNKPKSEFLGIQGKKKGKKKLIHSHSQENVKKTLKSKPKKEFLLHKVLKLNSEIIDNKPENKNSHLIQTKEKSNINSVNYNNCKIF